MSILKSFDELNAEQQLAWKMGYDAALREPPTDAQVEAAAKAFNGTYRDVETREMIQSPWEGDIEDMRAALEAAHNHTNRKEGS